jgi:hypothetical protein
LLLTIPVYEYWLTRVLQGQHETKGGLSTAADSIGIPVHSLSWQLMWVLLPLNALLWLALSSYPGRLPLWRGSRAWNWKTVMIEGTAVLLAATIAFVMVNAAVYGDWEFAILSLPWLFVVFCLRAVLLERATSSPRHSTESPNRAR